MKALLVDTVVFHFVCVAAWRLVARVVYGSTPLQSHWTAALERTGEVMAGGFIIVVAIIEA